MKLIRCFASKLIYVIMAILLITSLSVPVFADMWVPPSAIYDKGVLSQLDTASGRKDMNLFLTTFSEANMESRTGAEAPPMFEFMLKHFELNASLYPNVVIKNDSRTGKVMTIPLGTFDKAFREMFGFSLADNYYPFEGIDSYKNDRFIVTANQAGSPKKVFSIANSIKYTGENIYKTNFTIYKTELNPGSFYSCSSTDAEKSPNLKKIGDGYATFCYIGGTGPSAFILNDYEPRIPDKAELLYTEENKPVSVNDATTSAESEESTVSTATTAATDYAINSGSTDKTNTGTLILLTIAVVLAAIVAAVLIVLVYKKKK